MCCFFFGCSSSAVRCRLLCGQFSFQTHSVVYILQRFRYIGHAHLKVGNRSAYNWLNWRVFVRVPHRQLHSKASTNKQLKFVMHKRCVISCIHHSATLNSSLTISRQQKQKIKTNNFGLLFPKFVKIYSIGVHRMLARINVRTRNPTEECHSHIVLLHLIDFAHSAACTSQPMEYTMARVVGHRCVDWCLLDVESLHNPFDHLRICLACVFVFLLQSTRYYTRVVR